MRVKSLRWRNKVVRVVLQFDNQQAEDCGLLDGLLCIGFRILRGVKDRMNKYKLMEVSIALMFGSMI